MDEINEEQSLAFPTPYGEGLRESKMGRRLIFWMFFSALGRAIGPMAVRLFGGHFSGGKI